MGIVSTLESITMLLDLLWRPKSHNKSIIEILKLNNAGKYFVLCFCIIPPFGQVDTASLNQNISPYCPPSHAILIVYGLADI